MKNKFIVVALGFFLILFFVLLKINNAKRDRTNDYAGTIGIIQTASHPALDAVRQGFIDIIQEQANDKVDFVIRNGQGSISSLHSIAQQFSVKKDIDCVFAIATPAAQAIMSVEKEKPICIAAVSVSPAVAENFSQKNVCGVSDMIDVPLEIAAIRELLPTARTVGIIYCTAELNSVTVSQQMLQEIESCGLKAKMIGITSEADIEPALMSSLRKVDLILAPTDNMVAGAISLIADIMHKAHKPLIVSDNMLVKYGALMARGVDYYQSGRQAGKIVLDIVMNGKKPYELSIMSVHTRDIFINKKVSHDLAVVVPESLQKDVIFVE